MVKKGLSIGAIVGFIAFSGCKGKPGLGSALSVYDPAEGKFSSEACEDRRAVARMSKVKTDAYELILYNANYCNALKKTNRKKNELSFALQDGRDGTRKPVMIVYGYAGNAPSDQVEKQGVSDMMPWINQNFRPVVVPTGASVSEMQQVITTDRKQNPQDYGPDDWVGSIVASHGYVDNRDGLQKMVKTDVLNTRVDPNQVGPVNQSTSVRTTDVQAAIMQGVGSEAGTVYCMTWSCQSGGAMYDPQFESLKTSTINPDQKRIFQFSSAPDKLAGFSNTMTPNGVVTTTPAERSLVFASQAADPTKGLTVEQLQQKLGNANLGMSGGFDISTVYTPNTGISDTGSPFGVPSHQVATPLFSPQNPTVVGPRDAYVFPPGVSMNSFVPPVATGAQEIRSAEMSLPRDIMSSSTVREAPPQYSPNSPAFQPPPPVSSAPNATEVAPPPN